MALEFEERFIEHLQSFVPHDTENGFHKGNRGALAALRRGLGRKPGTEIAMYPYLGRLISGENDWQTQHLFLVASLFALHPKHDGKLLSLGKSFSILGDKLRKDGKNAESLEHRFTALLNADREDLHLHLRHAVSLLKSNSIAVNYSILTRDIRFWGERGSRTRRIWARDFWASLKPEDESGTEKQQ